MNLGYDCGYSAWLADQYCKRKKKESGFSGWRPTSDYPWNAENEEDGQIPWIYPGVPGLGFPQGDYQTEAPGFPDQEYISTRAGSNLHLGGRRTGKVNLNGLDDNSRFFNSHNSKYPQKKVVFLCVGRDECGVDFYWLSGRDILPGHSASHLFWSFRLGDLEMEIKSETRS